MNKSSDGARTIMFVARRRAIGWGFWGGLGMGALAGAAAALLLGRRRGAARRALVRDKAASYARGAAAQAQRRARDVAQRAWGRVHEAAHAGERTDPDVLVERVRAQIGKRVRHPRAIEVHAFAGTVVLTGPILRDEVQPLLDVVRDVRGVVHADDQLEVYDRGEDVPALQ